MTEQVDEEVEPETRPVLRRVVGNRVVIGAVALVLIVAFGAVYLGGLASRSHTGGPTVSTASAVGLRYIDENDGEQTVRVLSPSGTSSATSLHCQRFYQAGNTMLCLRLSEPGPDYEAAVLDTDGNLVKTVYLLGIPSRARVSASGRIVSWTDFTNGDSYGIPGGFSTRTGYYDRKTGQSIDSLETFTVFIDGRQESRANFNFWGMTVANDDRTFYATLGSGNDTWLVRGDIVTHTVHTVHTNAECPSLAPDQKHVAYKKRNAQGVWQLFVLDLSSGRETLIPGTLGVDDQAAWLDDHTLAYALGTGNPNVPPSIYTSAADGTGKPQLKVRDASSPSPA
jgi:hypothetical protein